MTNLYLFEQKTVSAETPDETTVIVSSLREGIPLNLGHLG